MTATVQKWGNSYGIRIPKDIMSKLIIRNGDVLSFSVKNNQLIINKTDELTLDNLCDRITKENKHSECSYNKPVGKEIW